MTLRQHPRRRVTHLPRMSRFHPKQVSGLRGMELDDTPAYRELALLSSSSRHQHSKLLISGVRRDGRDGKDMFDYKSVREPGFAWRTYALDLTPRFCECDIQNLSFCHSWLCPRIFKSLHAPASCAIPSPRRRRSGAVPSSSQRHSFSSLVPFLLAPRSRHEKVYHLPAQGTYSRISLP